MRPLHFVLATSAILVATLSPREAAASDSDWGWLALGLLEVTAATIVTGSVATASVAAESPDPNWGYASLGFGAGHTAIGSAFLIYGLVEDDDFSTVVGGIGIGIGLFGLTAGAVTQLTRPDEDPGLPATRWPSRSPTMVTWSGSF